jgi:formate dehydrogenase subunit gamma
MSAYLVRFSMRQRVEHFVMMALFTALCVTGLPQKYYDSGWALWMIQAMGGIDVARFIHRVAGVVFSLQIVVHFGAILFDVARGRASFSMVPNRKDFTDTIQMLQYYLRLRDDHPRFDRFDYRQKFEYWGLIMGGLVVSSTGLVLFMPILATQYLPGEIIPIAKMAHSYEGLLAFLTIVTWHIYNAHLSPDVFPYDSAIFTGRISVERMQKEHPIEYERLVNAGQTVPPDEQQKAVA